MEGGNRAAQGGASGLEGSDRQTQWLDSFRRSQRLSQRGGVQQEAGPETAGRRAHAGAIRRPEAGSRADAGKRAQGRIRQRGVGSVERDSRLLTFPYQIFG